ncbi:MAG TPA: S-layer protein [Candidatus Nanoarchaeia archaeon]|nr:S-layer protein [Candidatus Nanoarchaeia archaeon]
MRKTIQKISAIAAGVSMVGATIMGAVAADLSQYPAPFIKNGAFDALIVVGDDAASEDVVGAIGIGTSLQYAMRQAAAVSGNAQVTISEGKKIDRTGDHLNYGDEFQDILGAPLDDEDLPVILGDGTYQDSEGITDNKEDYEQRLYFYNTSEANDAGQKGSARLVFTTDDDGKKAAADYLEFDSGSTDYMYRYRLLFDTSIEYTNTSATDNTPGDDLEDTVLKIQGNDYTITDVQADSGAGYKAKKFTLLAGETIIWLQQGKTLTRTIGGVEHEIEVTDVNDNENMCGISVDGDVVWIDKGQTQTINGVTIGVTDAVAVHAQLQDVDICKINVGAREIIIDHTKEIKVDGVNVDGSQGDVIAGSPVSTKWDGFNITYVPSDEEYLPAGGSIVDPIFGNFEIRFEGVSKTTEQMTLDSGSDTAEFMFTNNDGKQVTIPMYWNGSSLNLGDDFTASTCDGRLLLEGDNCDVSASAGAGFNNLEGVQFVAVTSGKEAHILEVADIKSSSTENKTDIKDITYGKTYDDKTFVSGTNAAIELGSLGTVTLMISGNGSFTPVDVNLAPGNEIETKYGANISIQGDAWVPSTGTSTRDNANNTAFILLSEEPSETNQIQWNLSVYYYLTDDEVRISAPTYRAEQSTGNYNQSNVRASTDDKYTRYYITEWGTMVTYDSDNHNDLAITYPDDQTMGNAFVAPVGAVVVGAGGESAAFSLNPISTGAAKLASEITGQEKTQNLIVVGGPGANQAAAVISGLSYPAYGAASGIPENKAIIKLYESGENVALLVAGWSAEDTRRATTVLAKYSEYADKLVGNEVEISGTSMTDITVSAPTA